MTVRVWQPDMMLSSRDVPSAVHIVSTSPVSRTRLQLRRSYLKSVIHDTPSACRLSVSTAPKVLWLCCSYRTASPAMRTGGPACGR